MIRKPEVSDVSVSLPARGVWIEIVLCPIPLAGKLSLPARGVWIEMFVFSALRTQVSVTPREGSVD